MDLYKTFRLQKTIVLIMVILVLVSSVTSIRQASADVASSNFDEIDKYIQSRMKDLRIPGAALVIVQGDRIVHLQAFGVADATGRPVTPQSPFFTGSTGKSFTALAIMQLVEADKLKLDEPVQTYLPWFCVADADASKIITVRQLLNMTSGIPQAIGQEQIANFDLSDSAIENNVRALANVELSAAPGERYEYSNANYVTLGMIIQAVSGQSYEEYIVEHIFKPLDMQNSFTSKAEAQMHGLVAGYQNWFGIPVDSPNLPFSRGSLPAGQLNMSMEDFGHYLIAQLNAGSYQGVSVLSPNGIATLHHPDIPMEDSTHFYGMGWEVQHFQDVEVIRHNGQVPGYTTDMFLVPQEHIAIAMSMNTYSPMLGVRVARLPSSVLRMLLDQEVIPGYEFPHMRVIYALVMLIPVLHIAAVLATLRRLRLRQSNPQRPTRIQVASSIALPLLWNAALAYILLVILPKAFGANVSTVILFQPDVGWIATVSGVFAIVWGVLRTGILLSTFRQVFERQKKNQLSGMAP